MQRLQQEINQLLVNKKYSQAHKLLKVNQLKNPANPELLRLSGIVQLHQGKLFQAEKSFLKVLNLNPNYAPAMTNLAFIRQNKGDYVQAKIWLDKAISINPNSIETQHQLGNIYVILEEIEKAEFHFKQALILNPNHNESRLNLAILLKNKGEIETAILYIKESLAFNPLQPQVYWILANLKSYQFLDSEKNIVKYLLQQDVNQKDKVALLFTEAKILEDENKYADSFTVLKQANLTKRKLIKRKAVNWSEMLAKIKETFNPEFVAKNQNLSTQDKSPILIAGMPRSGSTLIEQILASHSQITGASELNHLYNLSENKGHSYPYNFKKFSKHQFDEIGSKYLKLTERWHNDTTLFTDKMPHNINYAGVLLMALPNARLIHSKRNPMDVCLSAFKQNFESGHSFSYALDELVQYYKFQDQLALYWQSLFPDRVISVEYEQVISNTEKEVRSLLKFLNLEFEPNCLEFYLTKRNIGTASAGQVTQKIYDSANDYYLNYGESLSELSELLKLPFGAEK